MPSSIRQKTLGRYFLCCSSSHGSLMCQCQVMGLRGHSCNLLLSCALNSMPPEGRKESWCWRLRASGWQLISKCGQQLRSVGKWSADAKTFHHHSPPMQARMQTETHWNNITQHDWRKEAPGADVQWEKRIWIKYGLMMQVWYNPVPGFNGESWIFILKEEKDKA